MDILCSSDSKYLNQSRSDNNPKIIAILNILFINLNLLISEKKQSELKQKKFKYLLRDINLSLTLKIKQKQI